MAVIRLLLSRDGTNYSERFSNNETFVSIVEKDSFAITKGFSSGSIRTQTCKCNVSGDAGYVSEFCSYGWAKVYKDNALVYTGHLKAVSIKIDTDTFRSCSVTYDDLSYDWKEKLFMPVIADDDPHRVVNYNGGNIDEDILYTQEQIDLLEQVLPWIKGYDELFHFGIYPTFAKELANQKKELSDLQEQKDGIVSWVLEYSEDDNSASVTFKGTQAGDVRIKMTESGMTVKAERDLTLINVSKKAGNEPEKRKEGNILHLKHNGFEYKLTVSQGSLEDEDTFKSENGVLAFKFDEK